VTLDLHGIWSPMPTPFDGNDGVDYARLKELVEYLVDGGVDGLFPLGTTGEFALLTREERKKVVATVVEQAKGRVPVLAGISDPSPINAAAFGSDAADVGASGVVATAPYYYTVSELGMYNHFKIIHDKVVLPLVLYNIPAWTHNFIPVSVVSRLVDEGTVVGMKYTEYDMLKLLEFIRAVGDKIPVFTGSDAFTYSCLEAGGKGAVISVSNIVPRRASRIYDLFVAGKSSDALKEQVSILPAIEAAGLGLFPAGLKESMKAAGFPVGEVRPPQTPLDEATKERVRALVKQVSAE
jgi:4-hydroxy-tetrahydrodipicolinate synthase